MKKAPLLADEAERLQALLDYNILDTEPDCELDEITRIAALVCQTPIALISLIDQERQWFKSRQGLLATETPRDISYCGHAIHQKEIFIVEDAGLDERFVDNPLYTGQPHVKFYAGSPLITPAGYGIGTLCVIDQKKRVLTVEQIQTLELLSKQVIKIFELKKSHLLLSQYINNLKEATQALQNRENYLIEISKSNFLNQLASGFAHEINNPLAIIKGKTSYLKSKFAKNNLSTEEAFQTLEKIDKAVNRIAGVTETLQKLSAASQSSHAKSEINLDTMLKLVINLYQAQTSNIEWVYTNSLPSKQVSIQMQPAQFVQGISAIIQNAIDCLLTITNPIIKIVLKSNQSEKWEIEISNTGPLIDPADYKKIFEPFITTKLAYKNIGLGLSTAKSIFSAEGIDIVVSKSSEGWQSFIIKPLNS